MAASVAGVLAASPDPSIRFGVVALDVASGVAADPVAVPMLHPDLVPAACMVVESRTYVAFHNASIDNNDVRAVTAVPPPPPRSS
jgi:hypothetical protein